MQQQNKNVPEINVKYPNTKQMKGKEAAMFYTIAIILLLLWVLGLFSGYTLGGVIHVLLVFALVVIVIQILQGRRRV